MAADCIADDIKANNHKHTHISCFPALAGRSIWPASHVYCQSTQAFSSHSPNFTHTTTTTETSRTLARAGILQHVYFALLDFPHNISDLVWGTQSAQSNYYTSKPTGPVDHILHIRLSFSSTFWPWYHPPLLGPHRSCLTPSSFWTRAIKKSTFYVSTKH